MNYLGHLSQSDPLFGYLSADILPQLGIKGPRSDFRVFKVGNDMYRDIFGAQRVGVTTIFVDSNQGAKFYENITPDFFAARFEQVMEGIVSAGSVR